MEEAPSTGYYGFGTVDGTDPIDDDACSLADAVSSN